MYKIDSFFLLHACSGSSKETFKQKKRVAEGYLDSATEHFLPPCHNQPSLYLSKHANFKNPSHREDIHIKKK